MINCVLPLLVANLSLNPQGAQSITDLARLADERAKAQAVADGADKDSKAATPAPKKKTLTNADLGVADPTAAPTAIPTAPAETKADSPAPTSAPTDATATPPKYDEVYWRKKLQPLWTQLDTDRIALRAAIARFDTYRGIATDRVMELKMADAADEMSRLTAAVTADQAAIADVEERARKADVPPGWLRR